MLNKIDKKAYLKEVYEFVNKYPEEVWSKIFELEEEFKKYFKAKYASACSNWTAWLILALKAIWVKKWDEVMMNINYFISDPNSVIILWLKPIFIDLWEKINSLSLDDIKSKITSKTRAIIIIHLYWYPIENTEEIIKFCSEKNIKVIEDCCQSIWAKIWNKYIWNFWDMWVFSFDSNKMVKWWEWWMIISKNKDLIEKTRFYKNNCKYNWSFKELWFNFRYNDFSSIYAKYSLRNLENIIKSKKNNIDSKNIIYKWSKNIIPSYYNYIKTIEDKNLKKDIKNKDYLKINLKYFPNLTKHLKEYEII